LRRVFYFPFHRNDKKLATEKRFFYNLFFYLPRREVMKTTVRLALVGDYHPSITAHQAIPKAVELAAQRFNISIHADWLATETITDDPASLSHFDAFWCTPGSPYRSTEGAIRAIRFAREQNKPFLGTCGGFQHAIIEYARNVMDWQDAGHGETDTGGRLVIAALACEMVEKQGSVTLLEGSIPAKAYARLEIEEGYRCRYGINTEFQSALAGQSLKMVGHDAAGEVRAIELPGHPFYVATLFQPERAALKGELPPLVAALIQAASI
jgi:CTP synthase (UTP-ammonia lyase)